MNINMNIKKMASKKIATKENLYKKLKQKNRPNEKFSDIIEPVFYIEENQMDISKSFGAWKNISDDLFNEMLDVNKKMQKQFEERFI